MSSRTSEQRRPRRAAITCLVAFSVPLATLGWVAADASANITPGAEHVQVRAARKALHQVQGTAGYDPRTMPALPATAGTGPQVPDVRGIVLDGKLGLSTSLEPTLKWGSGQVKFTVTDLAGRHLWSATGSGQARVGAGYLKNGGVYLWKAEGASGASPEYQFRVDTQGASAQSMSGYGGVEVASVTGEPVIAIGAISATLSYRPTNATAQFRHVGVPAGWQITTPSDAPWVRLRRVSDTRIELQSNSGFTVPFRQTSPGAWVATWGAGQNWPSGQYATLSQAVQNGAAHGQFQITERSGTVITFPDTAVGETSHVLSSWSARNPAPQGRYDATGRLTSLTDPISGHTVSLFYGGSGRCAGPSPGTGLKGAPEGMICGFAAWDGTKADVFYRATDSGAAGPLHGPLIARVVTNSQAPGDLLSQTDVGYDASGRLSTLRDPGVNATVASGVLAAAGISAANADDPNVLISLGYDSRGRVSTITRPAALVAGSADIPARGQRTFAYPSEGTIAMSEPGISGTLTTIASDPSDFLGRYSLDTNGLKTTTTWNAARQLPLTKTDPGGLVTTYEYDASGNVISTVGPTTTPASAAAPKTTEAYDTQEASTGRVATHGLRATYWDGTTMQGAPAGASVGPKTGDTTPVSLQFNWTAIGAGHAFAGRLEGAIVVPTGGISQITAGSNTQLWINGVECNGGCPSSLALDKAKAGDHLDVRIDVRSSASGVAAVNVQWTPPGTRSVASPATGVRPMLPNPTATTLRDQLGAGGSLVNLTTDVVYSAADPSQVLSSRSASQGVARRQYESWAPKSGHFTRATGATSMSGRHSSTTYYATGEGPAVDCPGTSTDQSGLAKTHTTPGGAVTTNAYNLSGQIVGQVTQGGVKTCTAYDQVGDTTSVTTTGAGSDGGTSTVVYEAVVGNNPLVSRTSYPGTDHAPQTTTTDLLGRTISATDTWGTTTSVTYDQDDLPVAATARTAAGEQTTLNTSYNRDGSVNQISRDGVVLSTNSYQASTDRLIGVNYANGASVGLGYDAQGNASTRTIVAGGQTISETAVLSPSGRTLSMAVSGPGTSARWTYGYDKDSHLTSAALAGTVPDGITPGTWAYTLDKAGQRTKVTSPYTSAEGYTYQYGPDGQMTATSDPRFADGFTYDPQGRATKAGPISLSYGPSGDTRAMTDGNVHTESTLLPDGTEIASTITEAGTPKSARYTLGGLILDTSGKITSQMVALPGGVSVQLPAPSATGAATWRYSDLSGSMGWQANDATAPATTQMYDPDGNRLSGPALSTDPAVPNPTFEGADTAPLSIPVSSMGAREYVPALGIFLQPDPQPESGLTAYNYANSDPVNQADTGGDAAFFSGQWWKENAISIGVAVLVTVVVTVATAGTATAATAPLWVALGKAALIGAVAGAAGDLATQTITDLANGEAVSIDWASVGTSAGIGAVLGGFGGGIGRARGAAKWRAAMPDKTYTTREGARVVGRPARTEILMAQKQNRAEYWQQFKLRDKKTWRPRPKEKVPTMQELMGGDVALDGVAGSSSIRQASGGGISYKSLRQDFGRQQSMSSSSSNSLDASRSSGQQMFRQFFLKALE